MSEAKNRVSPTMALGSLESESPFYTEENRLKKIFIKLKGLDGLDIAEIQFIKKYEEYLEQTNQTFKSIKNLSEATNETITEYLRDAFEHNKNHSNKGNSYSLDGIHPSLFQMELLKIVSDGKFHNFDKNQREVSQTVILRSFNELCAFEQKNILNAVQKVITHKQKNEEFEKKPKIVQNFISGIKNVRKRIFTQNDEIVPELNLEFFLSEMSQNANKRIPTKYIVSNDHRDKFIEDCRTLIRNNKR